MLALVAVVAFVVAWWVCRAIADFWGLGEGSSGLGRAPEAADRAAAARAAAPQDPLSAPVAEGSVESGLSDVQCAVLAGNVVRCASLLAGDDARERALFAEPAAQWTALHVAVAHGAIDLVRMLIEAGADPWMLCQTADDAVAVLCPASVAARVPRGELVDAFVLAQHCARPDAVRAALVRQAADDGVVSAPVAEMNAIAEEALGADFAGYLRSRAGGAADGGAW